MEKQLNQTAIDGSSNQPLSDQIEGIQEIYAGNLKNVDDEDDYDILSQDPANQLQSDELQNLQNSCHFVQSIINDIVYFIIDDVNNDNGGEQNNTQLKQFFKRKSSKSPQKQYNILSTHKDSIFNVENSYLFMEDYKTKSKYIDMRQLRQQANFTVKKYKDAIFMGQVDQESAKREGLGIHLQITFNIFNITFQIMIYKNGRVYEGPWLNDYREGKGLEIYENQNIYEGMFHRGKPEGKGIYRWLKTYEGEWYQGLKHGYGIWLGVKGDSYIGEWRNSKAEGYGIHIYKNGDRYEGEWKGNFKYGRGCELFTNGEVYIGYYKLGKFEGYGQYIWNDGSIYEGDFSQGLKHGIGKWRRSKDEAQWQYVQDKKHGYGTFKWGKTGNIYKGEYNQEEREGFGEMTWVDGSVYVGQWETGIQHGYGRIVFPDGTTKEGYFENNIFRGAIPPAFGISEHSMQTIKAQISVFLAKYIKFY